MSSTFPLPRIACVLSALVVTTFPAMAQNSPVAEIRKHDLKEHDVEWSDEYFWLRSKEEPAVRKYLEAENAYLAAQMGTPELKVLREKLVAEMKSRIVEEDVSVPYRRGKWLYYSRTVADAEHRVICRRPFVEGSGPEAKGNFDPKNRSGEAVMLDLNERAGDSTAYSFGGGAVSGDGRLYAWKENHQGTDRYTVRIKDLSSGELLDDEVPGAIFSDAPAWAEDGGSLFYTEGDDTDRSWRVRRHVLGTPAAEDAVVFQEDDARFQVWAQATKSQRFLLIGCSSKDTNEVSLLPLDQPDAKPQVVSPRRDGVRYSLSDCGDQWFIVSNDGDGEGGERAVNGRVLRAPLATPGREHWVEVLPADRKISYEWVSAFASHVVVSGRRDGVPGIFILEPDGVGTDDVRWVTTPGGDGWFETDETPEYQSSTQRVSYGTFVDPSTVADLDLATGEMTVLKTKKVPNYDRSKYRVERTMATATDGEKIPLRLVLPVDFPKDGSGAILLTGYGAYGAAMDPWCNTDLFSLLDRGFGFAIAQVRGGGEFGRVWYEDGKLAKKQNTFSDFASCAEHLITEGYTSVKQLCGTGGSAGGLLAGAVVNQRPELFRAFIADVPFVDVLNTMLDASIPLTTSEYDEWGNPSATREEFDRIRAYSPYDNVVAQDYPAMLVLAGWNDNRVPYWEAAKWVARLRAKKTDENLLLLSTEFDVGHGGASGRYSRLEEVALKFAFLLKETQRVGEMERWRVGEIGRRSKTKLQLRSVGRAVGGLWLGQRTGPQSLGTAATFVRRW